MAVAAAAKLTHSGSNLGGHDLAHEVGGEDGGRAVLGVAAQGLNL
jgi:hypothetical protein